MVQTIKNIVVWLKQWFYDKDEIDAMISGGGSVTVDDSLSTTSTNPVQNKVITSALNNKSDTGHTHNISDVTDLQTTLNGKQASLSVESTTITVTSPTSGNNYFSGGTREITARRYGKIVNVTINFYNVSSKQSGTAVDTTIATMPSGWRPIFIQYAHSSYVNKSSIANASFMVNTSGVISLRTGTADAQTSVTYRASFTYIVS